MVRQDEGQMRWRTQGFGLQAKRYRGGSHPLMKNADHLKATPAAVHILRPVLLAARKARSTAEYHTLSEPIRDGFAEALWCAYR